MLFFLFKKMRGGARASASAARAIAGPAHAGDPSRALPAAADPDADVAEIASPQQQLEEHEAQHRQFLTDVQARLNLPPVTSGKIEALVTHLRENVKKDPALVANVLRTWLEEGR